MQIHGAAVYDLPGETVAAGHAGRDTVDFAIPIIVQQPATEMPAGPSPVVQGSAVHAAAVLSGADGRQCAASIAPCSLPWLKSFERIPLLLVNLNVALTQLQQGRAMSDVVRRQIGMSRSAGE